MPIHDEHVDHWFKHGYVVISELFDPATVAAARDEAFHYFPPYEEFARNRPRYEHMLVPFAHADFPFDGRVLNQLCVHDDLVDFAERVMGTDELFMTVGALWSKYPGGHDFEQPLHSDHHNNTLLWPRDDGVFAYLPMIIYLSDVTLEDGPTHVLSRQHEDLSDSHGLGFRMREERPELYELEEPVVVTAGSVLIYSMRTLHRGSRMLATQAQRLSLHTAFRGAGKEWMGFQSFWQSSSLPAMKQFVTEATPKQRSLLGIPMPGDPYWTEETVLRNSERYPGIDLTPYSDAIQR